MDTQHVKITDVFDIVAATIRADTDISSFCQTRYKKAVRVFVGVDPMNPPEFENCPMVVITSSTRFRESRQAYRNHGIHVGAAIHDQNTTDENNVVRFLGIYRLEEFACLVETAVTKAMNAAGFQSDQTPGFEDVTTPPYFEAIWSYNQIRCKDILNHA